MKKLYEKSEIWFALLWIGLYVLLMNIGLQFCGGLDDLAGKTAGLVLVPAGIATALAIASTVWVCRHGLTEKYGLCRFKGDAKAFLWFIPLILVSVTNMQNGLALTTPLAVTLLMMVNKAMAGYVEEIIFRGFLFRAMAKENLCRAVVVSAVTFGAGHIVNLGNTADVLGVLLQVAYAIVIGFMYTAIVYKGGSLWPCIISHMVINASSMFALEEGPFSATVEAVLGQATAQSVQTVSAVLLMLVSGGYALWLWKRVAAPSAAA